MVFKQQNNTTPGINFTLNNRSELEEIFSGMTGAKFVTEPHQKCYISVFKESPTGAQFC